MGNISCFSLFFASVFFYTLFISFINAQDNNQAEVENEESALSYDFNDEQVLILPTMDDLRKKYKPTLADDPEEEDESRFSYVLGAPNGPQNWSNINPNWTKCGTGRSQSPINIVDNKVKVWPSLGNLIRRYKPASAIIQNRGHDIEVKWTEDAGGITINGSEFKLLQCHWHIPSEHTLNGLRYNMELHLVHSNSQNQLAVIGILYKFGKADPFLASLYPFISSAGGNGTDIGVVNPYEIGLKGKEYYRYNGSLTTPPCSENITWTILKTVKTVAPWQIQQMKDAVNDVCTGNARPVQKLNGRNIYLFRPRSWVESW